MKIISSYGVELRKQNIPIRQTLEIYRSAVCYLIEVYESVWEELAQIENSKKRFNAAEHLVHTTKRNPARFDFDFCFPKDAILFQTGGSPACAWECIFLSDASGTVESRGAENRESRIWKVNSMPCLFFTTMSCTVKTQKRKMRRF